MLSPQGEIIIPADYDLVLIVGGGVFMLMKDGKYGLASDKFEDAVHELSWDSVAGSVRLMP